MKAAVVFTGTGPILILTTYASFRDGHSLSGRSRLRGFLNAFFQEYHSRYCLLRRVQAAHTRFLWT